MGQLVAVTEKPSSSRGVVRFEINRTLSGMGHEHFGSVDDAWGNTPSDELARRMFATGKVEAVHVYANIVTVDLLKGCDSTGPVRCAARPVPVLEARCRAAGVRRSPARGSCLSLRRAVTAGEGGGELSEAAKRVPAHLLDRGRAARERWNAKNG